MIGALGPFWNPPGFSTPLPLHKRTRDPRKPPPSRNQPPPLLRTGRGESRCHIMESLIASTAVQALPGACRVALASSPLRFANIQVFRLQHAAHKRHAAPKASVPLLASSTIYRRLQSRRRFVHLSHPSRRRLVQPPGLAASGGAARRMDVRPTLSCLVTRDRRPSIWTRPRGSQIFPTDPTT